VRLRARGAEGQPGRSRGRFLRAPGHRGQQRRNLLDRLLPRDRPGRSAATAGRPCRRELQRRPRRLAAPAHLRKRADGYDDVNRRARVRGTGLLRLGEGGRPRPRPGPGHGRAAARDQGERHRAYGHDPDDERPHQRHRDPRRPAARSLPGRAAGGTPLPRGLPGERRSLHERDAPDGPAVPGRDRGLHAPVTRPDSRGPAGALEGDKRRLEPASDPRHVHLVRGQPEEARRRLRRVRAVPPASCSRRG
jgi:hypothetical protein